MKIELSKDELKLINFALSCKSHELQTSIDSIREGNYECLSINLYQDSLNKVNMVNRKIIECIMEINTVS